MYECVKISLVGRKQVQCRKDSTASKRHVSMFVQEPRLTKELLSFKKSMVRFLFNGEGLDVHLVDLFFFLHLSCPPFFCQTSSRSPCIYICPRSTNYQKYSIGIWIVVGLAHRCHPPHLQPLGVQLLLRALFLQFSICIFWSIAAFDEHIDSALLHQGYRIYASLILHVVHNDKSNFHLAAALCYP